MFVEMERNMPNCKLDTPLGKGNIRIFKESGKESVRNPSETLDTLDTMIPIEYAVLSLK